MDPATLIGLAVAFGAILGAIILEGANPLSVFLPAPMLLVIVGTIGAALAGVRMADIGLIIAATKKASSL